MFILQMIEKNDNKLIVFYKTKVGISTNKKLSWIFSDINLAKKNVAILMRRPNVKDVNIILHTKNNKDFKTKARYDVKF